MAGLTTALAEAPPHELINLFNQVERRSCLMKLAKLHLESAGALKHLTANEECP